LPDRQDEYAVISEAAAAEEEVSGGEEEEDTPTVDLPPGHLGSAK
jgi:hypothetical protein